MPNGHVITHFTRAQHPPAQRQKKRVAASTIGGQKKNQPIATQICWCGFVTWDADRTEYAIFILLLLLCLAPSSAPRLGVLPGCSASVLQAAGAASLQAVGGGARASLAVGLLLPQDEPLSLRVTTHTR